VSEVKGGGGKRKGAPSGFEPKRGKWKGFDPLKRWARVGGKDITGQVQKEKDAFIGVQTLGRNVSNSAWWGGGLMPVSKKKNRKFLSEVP